MVAAIACPSDLWRAMEAFAML